MSVVDPKLPPATNGQGTQEQLRRWKHEVETWVQLHESWVETNHQNGLKPNQQGFVLLRVLTGRARDLCRNIPVSQIKSAKGVETIVKCVIQSNADTDIQYQMDLMDKIQSIYRRDGQKMGDYCSLFKSLIEKYIDLTGTLSERMQEWFALEMLRRAALEPGVRATVLTSALNITNQERQVSMSRKYYDALIGSSIQQHESAPNLTVTQTIMSGPRLVGMIGEIKALIDEVPESQVSTLQLILQNASTLSTKLSEIPTTSDAHYLDSQPQSQEEEAHIVPAVTDGISNSYREELTDAVRALRIALDTCISQHLSSKGRLSSITEKILEVAENLKKAVIEMEVNSYSNDRNIISSVKSTETAPARVTISAITAALAPLDVFGRSSSGMTIKSLYGTQMRTELTRRDKPVQRAPHGKRSGERPKRTREPCTYEKCTRDRTTHDYEHCYSRINDERKAKKKQSNSGSDSGPQSLLHDNSFPKN